MAGAYSDVELPDVVGRKSRYDTAIAMQTRRQEGEIAGRRARRGARGRAHDELNDTFSLEMMFSGAGGEEKLELHFRRRSGALADPWRIKPRAQSEKHKKEMDLRGKVVGQIGENCLVVPLQKFLSLIHI